LVPGEFVIVADRGLLLDLLGREEPSGPGVGVGEPGCVRGHSHEGIAEAPGAFVLVGVGADGLGPGLGVTQGHLECGGVADVTRAVRPSHELEPTGEVALDLRPKGLFRILLGDGLHPLLDLLVYVGLVAELKPPPIGHWVGVPAIAPEAAHGFAGLGSGFVESEGGEGHLGLVQAAVGRQG